MQDKIYVNKLSFSVPNKDILKDISIRVKEKQFVGLVGPNGSGKTTMLKHMYRVLSPNHNTVFINGKEIEKFSYQESAKQIAVMKQEHSSDFDYTIKDIVLMGRSPHKKIYQREDANDFAIVDRSLDYVGMKSQKDRLFSTLSGGEKQRVLIARSLAQQADILILDEPTNHLDIHYQWHLMETIAALNKTVLSVFHELNLACKFCDYLYVLKDGQIFKHGKPKDICTVEMLRDVFRIEAEIIDREKEKPYIVYRNSI